jgi:hypothetical protein
MLTKHVLLLLPTLAVGWLGTRTALSIHRGQGRRRDVLFMLVLGWSPLLSWTLSLWVALSGWNP